MSELTMIGVRVSPDLRERVAAVVADLQATEPGVTTSDVARRALVAFVLKAERERERGAR